MDKCKSFPHSFFRRSFIYVIISLLPFFNFVSASEKEEFNVGFNQAWIKTNFGHQWTSPAYDSKEVKRLLDLNQKAGSKTIRMWLFEGVETSALIWKEGKVAGINPEFLKNFEEFLKEAKKRGIKVYPTLFSPGALDHSKDKAINDRWWNLFNDKFQAMDAFKENALRPLMNLLNRPEYQSSIFGIDVANEIDTGVLHDKFENKWSGANKFICGLKKEINPIPMTASLGWGIAVVKNPTSLGISRGAENIILDPNPHPDCVDFWDIHVYRDSGEIKNCEKIKSMAQKYHKKIYLGEFGQDSDKFNDELQKTNAENFIRNAKRCGFSGALAWRLSDVRDGVNPDARHSFEAVEVSKMRPAFEVIQKNNLAETHCKSTGDSCTVDECHLLSVDYVVIDGKCINPNSNENHSGPGDINDSHINTKLNFIKLDKAFESSGTQK